MSPAFPICFNGEDAVAILQRNLSRAVEETNRQGEDWVHPLVQARRGQRTENVLVVPGRVMLNIMLAESA